MYYSIAREGADGMAESRVRLAGEFDLSARDELRETLLDVVERDRTGRVVVGLDEVTFIDSEAIGAVHDGYLAASRAGADFRLAGAHGVVWRVLEVLGLAGLTEPAEPATSPPRP